MRRRQAISKTTTFEDIPIITPADPILNNDININNKETIKDSYSSSSTSSSSSSSPSLAAQAIRASAMHREYSSLSSAYGHPYFPAKDNTTTYEYTSLRSSNESKGFWGVLAQKAKSVLEDDDISHQFEATTRPRLGISETTTGDQPYQSHDRSKKLDNPRLRKGLDALSNSLNHIGGTIGNVIEEGRTMVENKTHNIIQETRKLQNRRKGSGFEEQNQAPGAYTPWQKHPPTQSEMQSNQDTQLKASRDVAMATAAKAKLILRELKTVKADLAFAKERCSQLEEENKLLRESREKGINPADDDMIRLQLETLLAEKARLAHENSVFARENRFLREIVEYHQLTMQGVVYFDDGTDLDDGIEATEDDPFPAVTRMLSITPPSSPPSLHEKSTSVAPTLESDVSKTKKSLHERQIETPQKDDPEMNISKTKKPPRELQMETPQKDNPETDISKTKKPLHELQKEEPQNDDPHTVKTKNPASKT